MTFNKITEEQAKETAERGAQNMTQEEVDQLMAKESSFYKIVHVLKDVADNAKWSWKMVKDYCSGNYREVPFATITGLAFALAYFLSPIDMIPDFIPVVGYTDDISVFAITMKLIGSDLEDYKVWKQQQENTLDVSVEENK